MDKIEKIQAEIERLYNEKAPRHDQQCDFDDGYFMGIDTISQFIDTLELEEPDKSLEEAAEKYANKEYPDEPSCGQWGTGNYEPPVDMEYPREVAKDAFIAGAKWQAEKCDEETSKLLYAERQTAYINGWDDHKEQMMKDAVEGEVHKYDKFSYVKEKNSKSLTELLTKFNNSDKVHIIILKAEEEKK